jgi:hypothetical protein
MITKSKMSTKLNYLVVFSAFFLFSCKGESEKKEVKVEVETENKFNSEEFDFVLPQPISLAKAFQASGISYKANLTNPSSNKGKYSSKIKQLLNLGVYSTDLAYCAINGKAQEARGYLKAIQELGNSVGLKPVFSDKKLAEKFDESLDNMEAIEDLIYDIQERSEEYMEDNDVRYLAVVQFSGSWTEGMYLGVKNYEEQKDNDKISITLIDQISLLKNIIKGIKTYPTSDETLTQVISKLSDILSTYENFETVKKANESSTFVSPKLSDSELQILSDKIKDLRNYIVS